MEKRTRVYPAQTAAGGRLSICLLILTALVVLSGLIWREPVGEMSIVPVPQATSVPMDEAFDETYAVKEISLPSSEWYALQLGAFESEASALEMARQYAMRGAAGYVWHDGRWRTLAAVYPDREDASHVRQQLETQHGVDTYLYQISLPQIRLKLSGMQGQLEILEAAFLHANDLAAALQVCSVTMDRREMNVQEAGKQLRSLDEQMQLIALRLRQRFAEPRPDAVECLTALVDDYGAFCSKLTDQDSAAALAAKIKYQTFCVLNALKHVYDELSHT